VIESQAADFGRTRPSSHLAKTQTPKKKSKARKKEAIEQLRFVFSPTSQD